MLPLMIDPSQVKVALVGNGDLLVRRRALLEEAGVNNLSIYEDRLPTSQDLASVSLLFVAGLAAQEAEPLVAAARAGGILVNTEDNKPLCDFHVPASVRRGDLLMTVSTGGNSPGLARRLRKHLEKEFSSEWEARVTEISEARSEWREEGLDLKAIAKKSDAFIDDKGWLK